MKIDYKNGKVQYEDDKFVKFFREHDKVVFLGDKSKVERLFRKDIMDIGAFFDDYYKDKTIDLREVKYLLIDINLMTDNYYVIFKKIIDANKFKKVVLCVAGALSKLNLNKYNIEELKKEYEVYYE